MAENVRVRFIKLNEFAKQPTYANEYAAGADLYAATNEKIEIKPMQTVMVGTGIATEIPNGDVGLVEIHLDDRDLLLADIE